MSQFWKSVGVLEVSPLGSEMFAFFSMTFSPFLLAYRPVLMSSFYRNCVVKYYSYKSQAKDFEKTQFSPWYNMKSILKLECDPCE